MGNIIKMGDKSNRFDLNTMAGSLRYCDYKGWLDNTDSDINITDCGNTCTLTIKNIKIDNIYSLKNFIENYNINNIDQDELDDMLIRQKIKNQLNRKTMLYQEVSAIGGNIIYPGDIIKIENTIYEILNYDIFTQKYTVKNLSDDNKFTISDIFLKLMTFSIVSSKMLRQEIINYDKTKLKKTYPLIYISPKSKTKIFNNPVYKERLDSTLINTESFNNYGTINNVEYERKLMANNDVNVSDINNNYYDSTFNPMPYNFDENNYSPLIEEKNIYSPYYNGNYSKFLISSDTYSNCSNDIDNYSNYSTDIDNYSLNSSDYSELSYTDNKNNDIDTYSIDLSNCLKSNNNDKDENINDDIDTYSLDLKSNNNDDIDTYSLDLKSNNNDKDENINDKYPNCLKIVNYENNNTTFNTIPYMPINSYDDIDINSELNSNLPLSNSKIPSNIDEIDKFLNEIFKKTDDKNTETTNNDNLNIVNTDEKSTEIANNDNLNIFNDNNISYDNSTKPFNIQLIKKKKPLSIIIPNKNLKSSPINIVKLSSPVSTNKLSMSLPKNQQESSKLLWSKVNNSIKQRAAMYEVNKNTMFNKSLWNIIHKDIINTVKLKNQREKNKEYLKEIHTIINETRVDYQSESNTEYEFDFETYSSDSESNIQYTNKKKSSDIIIALVKGKLVRDKYATIS